MRKLERFVLFALMLGVTASLAPAITVGYYTMFNNDTTTPETPILANGFTPVHIMDLSTFDFSTVDIFFVNNSFNSAVDAAYLARQPDITAYVSSGGKIVIHDRYVVNKAIIPGGAGVTLVRDFSVDTDLEVVTSGNLVINGPFGTITNATLDGGTSSNHGWAVGATLPAGSTVYLSAGADPNRAAAFSFLLGDGLVYYSSIPLDYYLDGFGPDAVRANMVDIYAPNVLAYAASIPEPGAFVLIGSGLLLVTLAHRRRKS